VYSNNTHFIRVLQFIACHFITCHRKNHRESQKNQKFNTKYNAIAQQQTSNYDVQDGCFSSGDKQSDPHECFSDYGIVN
jgi:hypothetical protein